MSVIDESIELNLVKQKITKEYSSEKELFGIIHRYYNKKNVSFDISSGSITIRYKDFERGYESRIERAIRKLEEHKILPNILNVSKYLNISQHKLRFYIRNSKIKDRIVRGRRESKDGRGRSHPLYKKMFTVWRGMIQRCHNPNHMAYHSYGGRGILVCNRWRHFNNFFDDMHETYIDGLTLDRIDNDDGYHFKNCKWSNQQEQTRNTRMGIYLIYNGKLTNLLYILEELQIKKYLRLIKLNINDSSIDNWDEYMNLYGVRVQNLQFCCLQHFFDHYSIKPIIVRSLLKRYYTIYKNNVPPPSIKNIKWYIDNYNNFIINLLKFNNKEKLYKEDIMNTNRGYSNEML